MYVEYQKNDQTYGEKKIPFALSCSFQYLEQILKALKNEKFVTTNKQQQQHDNDNEMNGETI